MPSLGPLHIKCRREPGQGFVRQHHAAPTDSRTRLSSTRAQYQSPPCVGAFNNLGRFPWVGQKKKHPCRGNARALGEFRSSSLSRKGRRRKAGRRSFHPTRTFGWPAEGSRRGAMRGPHILVVHATASRRNPLHRASSFRHQFHFDRALSHALENHSVVSNRVPCDPSRMHPCTRA